MVVMQSRLSGKTDRTPDAGPASGTDNASARGTPGEAARSSQGSRRERIPPAEWERQRRAALDLATRMRTKQGSMVSDSTVWEGDERGFPQELLEELAGMNAPQFRLVTLDLSKDQTIPGADRALLTAMMTDRWLVRHAEEGTEALKAILGVIDEVLPELPRGFETMPVSVAMGRSLEWDPAGHSLAPNPGKPHLFIRALQGTMKTGTIGWAHDNLGQVISGATNHACVGWGF